MAGQAAKKLEKTRTSRMRYVSAISVLSFVIFVAVSWFTQDAIPIFRSLLFLSLLGVSVFMIDAALAQGVDYEIWQDIFIVTVASLLLSCLWSGGVWLLLLVPGYGVYLWGGQALQALARIGKTDEAAEEEKTKKPKRKY